MSKNSNYLVSVVIPVFNVRGYLHRCLDSVLSQTYSKLQVILVDDGSTDGSGEICDEIAVTDLRVEVLHTANCGLAAARNAGMELVRGSYVVFVDSDDLLGPDHIFNLVNALSDCKDVSKSVVVTGFTPVSVGETVNVSSSSDLNPSYFSTSQAIAESVTIGGRFGAHAWGKLYPKRLFEFLTYPVGSYYEDQFVTYKIFLAASEIVYIDSNDYLYTINRPGSISVGSRIRELDYLDAIRITLLDIRKECPAAAQAVESRYLISLIYSVETACLSNRFGLFNSLFNEALSCRANAFEKDALNNKIKVKYWALEFGPRLFAALVKARFCLASVDKAWVFDKFRAKFLSPLNSMKVVSKYSKLLKDCDGSTAFLVMTPRYRNYGDQLIAFSETELLHAAGIHKIVEIPYEECQVMSKAFSRLLKDGDIVYFTGGGYLGDLWPGLDHTAEQLLLALSPNNKAFFFPESVFNSKNDDLRFVQTVNYSRAPVMLCARESATYSRLCRSINQEAVYLFPDVGLFVRKSDILNMIPKRIPNSALVCIRHDKESLQGVNFGLSLTSALEECGLAISAIDTHDPIGETAPDSRRAEIGELAKRFAEASLVVTNRLHGMVLAMIMGTPCVALDNVSGKVSGVARWVAGKYPLIISSEDEIVDAVKEASTFAPYDGDVADLLEDQKSALIELIKEVAVNE